MNIVCAEPVYIINGIVLRLVERLSVLQVKSGLAEIIVHLFRRVRVETSHIITHCVGGFRPTAFYACLFIPLTLELGFSVTLSTCAYWSVRILATRFHV